jgi:hypothetical protein
MALTDTATPDRRRAWELPPAAVAGQQDVDPATGLDSATTAARLDRDGPNEVPLHPPTPLWRSVTGQLRDTLVLVLLAAAVLTAITGDAVDTAVILLVVTVNTVLGVAQERRALREVRALDALVAPTARVTRNGADSWVPTRELVRGAILRLAAGDVVGADGRLLDSVLLQVDEALLTGESQPSAWNAAAVSPRPTAMAERTGMVHAGSTVLAGSGTATKVIAVELPQSHAFMHLDTLFTMVDVDTFVGYPYLDIDGLGTWMITPVDAEAVVDADTGGLHVERREGLFPTIADALGLEEIRVLVADEDTRAAEREQWDDANNFLTVAPGVVIGYERNVVTNTMLTKNGVEMLAVPGSEPGRGRGGSPCMTCPIQRDGI